MCCFHDCNAQQEICQHFNCAKHSSLSPSCPTGEVMLVLRQGFLLFLISSCCPMPWVNWPFLRGLFLCWGAVSVHFSPLSFTIQMRLQPHFRGYLMLYMLSDVTELTNPLLVWSQTALSSACTQQRLLTLSGRLKTLCFNENFSSVFLSKQRNSQ